jgi:hypothetical protein
MNEQTLTRTPEEVVPVPVPVAGPVSVSAPGSVPVPASVAVSVPAPASVSERAVASDTAAKAAPETPAVASASSADQLPTTRLPSLASILPPPVPPPGPAHKTQPLRAITRDAAAAKLADAGKRRPWKNVLGHVTRVAAAVPSSVGSLPFGRALRSEAWTERRVGVLSAALGAVMIAGALVLGWLSVTGDRFDKLEPASITVAIVLARAALAIATMTVGFGLMRVGERTLVTSVRPDAGVRPR